MKKLYAFLALVVAATLSMSAALTPKFGTGVATLPKVEGQATLSKAQPEMKTNSAVKFAKVQAPARAAGEITPEGEYVMLYDNSSGDQNMATFSVIPGEGEGQYFIHHFIYSDVNDIPATFVYSETNDLYFLAINGQGTEVFFSDGGEDYGLWLFGYEEGKPTVYTNDILFVVYEEAMEIAYTDCGIAWLNSSSRGNWVTNILGYKTNATMEINEVDPEDVPKGVIDAYTARMFTMYEQARGVMYILNFAGLRGMVGAAVDADNKLVYIPTQPVWTGYTPAGEEVEFDLYVVDMEELIISEDPLTFTITADEYNRTVLVTDQTWCALNEDYGIVIAVGPGNIVLDYNIWGEEVTTPNEDPQEETKVSAYQIDPATLAVLANGGLYRFDVIKLNEELQMALMYKGNELYTSLAPDDTNNHLYIWDGTFAAADITAPGPDGYTDYLNLNVTNHGWSGAGFNVAAPVDLSHFNDKTHMHIAYRTDNAPASVGLILGEKAPAKFAVGKEAFNDNGVEFPLVGYYAAKDGWAAIDITFAQIKELWPAFDYTDMSSFTGNILSFLAGGVEGTNIGLDAIFFYTPLEPEEEKENKLYVSDFSMHADCTMAVDVVLENYDFDIAALQFNMTVSSDLSVDNLVAGSRVEDHILAYKDNDGVYTVVIYSLTNANFPGEEGSVVTMDVTTSSSFTGGTIKFFNVIATEADGAQHNLEDTETAVKEITGVEAVANDNVPAVYYNMQGVRLGTERPATGLYIELRSNRARKVLVK